MRRVCIVNPDTKRCVFSDTPTGKKVVKKHVIIPGNCRYDEIFKRCVKNNRVTPPKPKTLTPSMSISSSNYIPKILNPAQSLTEYLNTINVKTSDLEKIFKTSGFKINSKTLIPKNSASDSIITKLDLENDISIIFNTL